VKNLLSEIAEYLREKIAEVRLARFIGEIIWALGSVFSVVALFLKIFFVTVVGFSLLFVGSYLSVHFELQRLDYIHALERASRQE